MNNILPRSELRLWLMRSLWITLVTLSIGLVVVSLPSRYAQLASISPHTAHQAYWLRAPEADALTQWGWTLQGYATYILFFQLIGIGAFCLIAFVIYWSGRRDPYRIFLSLALITFITTLASITDALVEQQPQWDPWVNAVQAIGFGALPLIYYLFPDGRFVPRWTRPLALVWVVLMTVWYFFPAVPFNPVYGNTWEQTPWLSWLVSASWPLSGVAAQTIRYLKYADAAQRQQILWIVIGFAFATLAGLIRFAPPLHPALQTPGVDSLRLEVLTLPPATLLMIGWPLALSYAIVRHHLWDTIVNRSIVYGLLILSIFGLYVLTVNTVGAILGPFGNALTAPTATTLSIVIFQPLRDRLRRIVNRAMYGQRDEPYAVVSQLGKRLETTPTPDAVLPTIVETVAQALKLPYVAVSVNSYQSAVNGERPAANGQQPTVISAEWRSDSSLLTDHGSLFTLPLTYQGEVIGELHLAPRAPNEPFTPQDQRLLADLARQVGVAAHAVRLVADLQRSREQLVMAHEEERRKLSRDLHDGLGPTLSALKLQLGTLRRLISQDPARAEALAIELGDEMRAATEAIRQMARDLRPLKLDELGLVGALRATANSFSIAADAQPPLQLTVIAPEPLPPLSAAVEVAAYRIAQEAINNVAKYAQARHCEVRLSFADSGVAGVARGATTDTRPSLHALRSTLTLEVSDDGCGLPANYHAGVGFRSMRERAAELGGTCVIENIPNGGTRVYAHLPLSRVNE